jgi:type III pantothenate kinase
VFLAVDIGNSRIKLGVYDGENLSEKFSVRTNEIDSGSLANLRGIDAAIICSVVPHATEHVANTIRERFSIEPTIVRNDFDFGLNILHSPLETIGTDRLVNAFSAVEKYGAPSIVCSIGTALTIDYVDENRVLRGGAIAPGMEMLARSLHSETAQLPEVDIAMPDSILQHTTVGALQSGVVKGFVGMLEALIAGIKSEIADQPKVIATGGSARFVADHTKTIDIIDESLLLDGLLLCQNRLR